MPTTVPLVMVALSHGKKVFELAIAFDMLMMPLNQIDLYSAKFIFL